MFTSPFAGDADGLWTLEEASENLAVPLQDMEEDRKEGYDKNPQWRTAFKKDVTFDERTNLEKYLDKPVCTTRHDLRFKTLNGRTIRCNV